ncbi:hypothetical protein LCGC14_1181750 [marine sediment metagenome]|uniref:Uncharacterized protein n=1 Tax=marine sediment metagenome TaxID=412755 RepID=A0A0F9LRQ3_9ZZZZ
MGTARERCVRCGHADNEHMRNGRCVSHRCTCRGFVATGKLERAYDAKLRAYEQAQTRALDLRDEADQAYDAWQAAAAESGEMT